MNESHKAVMGNSTSLMCGPRGLPRFIRDVSGPKRAGFTLVEIALALLVVSVGLVAVMGLFPTGLSTNRQALDETQAVLFAEEVFSGLQASAMVTPWEQIQSIELEPAGWANWDNRYDLFIQITGNSTLTNRYRVEVPGEDSYQNHAIRYRLRMEPIGSRRMGVYLEVAPGEGGGRWFPFYTEIFNHGRM